MEKQTLPLQHEIPLVIFDTETTGLDVNEDRIVEFAAVKLVNGEVTLDYCQRFNPCIPIPEEASRTHHITNADVVDAPRFKDTAQWLYTHFFEGCAFAGYNILCYDLPLVQAEFARCGITFDYANASVIDSLRIFEKYTPRTLSDALKYFCDEEHKDAHSALSDVMGSLNLLRCQLGRCNGIPKSLTELNVFCRSKDPNWLDERGRIIKENGKLLYNFGKNRYMDVRRVHKENPGYLDVVYGYKMFSSEIYAILRGYIAGKAVT